MSAARNPELESWLETLRPLGEPAARRMFGGVGLYLDGVFFGLVAEGVLYFKVDAATIEDYRAAGMPAFRPYADRPAVELGYREVPLEVQEDRARFLEWARRALAAAARRDAARRPRSARPATGKGGRGPAARRAPPLTSLPNIGPRSAAWLAAVGIHDRAALERLGSVRAYRKVLESGARPGLNLLYALDGAQLDLRWDRLPEAVKANLRLRAGAPP